ncbi:MotA/TolQ/ExbB proton channel family protein [Thalassovita taeanensis]|uniref:Biopolymer transport protein ExbB n=1 Tax=Thalassovita taeanensis TaxID=657014 RepID=A0A1H8ZA02_9RHOB|nr:MotA/TolQ/ExbB proton channel family protein [Thalassovita taeanensis]SEP61192.1 biopolymer transport protein ExbB [Thalassovita taeanensis]
MPIPGKRAIPTAITFLALLVGPILAQDLPADSFRIDTTAPVLMAPADDRAATFRSSASELSPQPVTVAEAAAPSPDESATEPLSTTVPDQILEHPAVSFLIAGGASLWAIAGLSVATVGLILWKIWALLLLGAWSRRRARRAVRLWQNGDLARAEDTVRNRRGLRNRVLERAFSSSQRLPEPTAREETTRVAQRVLGDATTGLRALELIATTAPLLGLLGTVLGMISAFQALQHSGAQADPALLAGGIWKALLTTAAGMAVAIPASVALSAFDAVIERVRRDIEDLCTRVFVAQVERGLSADAPPQAHAA